MQQFGAGAEDVYEEPADPRARLDDPFTFHIAGQCEHLYTSDPALLRIDVLETGYADAAGEACAPMVRVGRAEPPRESGLAVQRGLRFANGRGE